MWFLADLVAVVIVIAAVVGGLLSLYGGRTARREGE
jgi:hypothetical protein